MELSLSDLCRRAQGELFQWSEKGRHWFSGDLAPEAVLVDSSVREGVTATCFFHVLWETSLLERNKMNKREKNNEAYEEE